MTQHTRWTLTLLTLTALTMAACGTPPPPPDPAPAPKAEPEHRKPEHNDGHQRLSAKAVTPTDYRLTMQIDPRQEMFQGAVEIDVEIKEKTWFVQLHSGELEIQSAAIKNAAGTEIALKVNNGENKGLVLEAPEALATGKWTVHIKYEGDLGTVPESLYRVEVESGWYAYTQFEPLEARDAFPCFDEPRFKTPFTLTLKAPKGMTALANTPETGRTDEGDWTTFTFAPSQPLPTYLVAVAVGEFDIVEASEEAAPGVPLRAVTTKGKGHLTKYALENTKALVTSLTDYFDAPFPYKKIDLVAVPNFSAGAMENVGLITFRETLLLFDGQRAPIRTRYAFQSVNAHELAHMWFGNLVTPMWWDDLWLNEAFATWMATRVVADVAPELEAPLDAIRSSGWVMGADSKEATRAVRQPIEHGGDVYNAFDGITYTKGAAVLRMMEAWSGEDAFRDGVRAYIKAHQHGNAATGDLLAALEKSTGKPVVATIDKFINQPGVPFIKVEVACDGPKPAVTLSQTRYLPAGSKAPQGDAWRVPVCMRHEVNGEVGRTCVELEGPTGTFELDVAACPTWLHPNADESGYYRWRLDDKALVALLNNHRQKLTLPERAALPAILGGLLEADAITADAYIASVAALANEEHRIIVNGVLGSVSFLKRRAVADKPASRKKFQRWAKGLIAPHMKRVGLRPAKDEPAEVGMLRPRLISAMVKTVGDRKVIAAVVKDARKFLKDPASVPADIAAIGLMEIARGNKAKDHDALVATLPKVPDPQARRAVMAALGSFTDEALLRKSFDLLLDGTLKAQDMWSVISPTFGKPQTHAIMWTWMTEHYDKLIEVRGAQSATGMPWLASGFCDAEGRATAEAFFAPEARRPAGTDRNLSLVLENVDLCIRQAKRVADSF